MTKKPKFPQAGGGRSLIIAANQIGLRRLTGSGHSAASAASSARSLDSKNQLVGVALATQVACKLENGAILAYTHRDYCGIGLRYVDGQYVCGEVFDGALPSPTEVKAWQESANVEWMAFESRPAFVAWLSRQSDDSLSGQHLPQAFAHNNQRLTIDRLKKFVSGQGE